MQGTIRLGARNDTFGCKERQAWVEGMIRLGARNDRLGCKERQAWVEGTIRLGATRPLAIVYNKILSFFLSLMKVIFKVISRSYYLSFIHSGFVV